MDGWLLLLSPELLLRPVVSSASHPSQLHCPESRESGPRGPGARGPVFCRPVSSSPALTRLPALGERLGCAHRSPTLTKSGCRAYGAAGVKHGENKPGAGAGHRQPAWLEHMPQKKKPRYCESVGEVLRARRARQITKK